MARMHLDDERFIKMLQARRGDNEPVDEAVVKVLSSDVAR